MKDLGITRGEWQTEEYHDGDLIGLSVVSDQGDVIYDNGITSWISEEEEANAKLIADAGTTANKCGLFASELLDQREEMLEMLQRIERLYDDGTQTYKDLVELIQKITKP